MLKTLSLAAIGLAVTAVAALAADPAMVGDTAKGKALTDPNGMTLYTFDKDSGGKSACNGACAGNWPPLAAAADAKAAGDYSVVKRDDGSAQWAYKGKPLYTFVNDAKAGDASGEGLGGNTWHIAAP
jgi:predicted lipoprotein with Yx(FWY)xxD motif